jgi:NADH-quinone oxidoreductase subunit L
MTSNELVWLIFFFPLTAFIVNGIFFTLFSSRNYKLTGIINVITIGISFALSLILVFRGVDSTLDYQSGSFQWMSFGLFEITMGVMLDQLTIVMISVVTAISFLIQIYSISYMKHDEGYARYFTYMALFTTSMLGLVFSRNLIQLFIFWELVGAASYLLIGFWFTKQSAIKAAKKAFLMTRVGDFGLLIGILLLAKEGSQYLDITVLYMAVHNGIFSEELVTILGLLILVGAIGKSAQFPLHNWLPDAMEGPTPVSALLHSATMVTAGVFLIGRMFPVISSVDLVSNVTAYIGAFTLIFAATMAIVSNDIKKVLAYSSISQLGYMFLALGVGAYGAAFFHLFTHAWFKALLFLGAGSVGHSVHTFDMNKMGGLRRHMKITYWFMLLGAISLIGIFPLSGFWSKDEMLIGIQDSGSDSLLIVALIGVVMTAYYMTRMITMTFFGEYKGGESGDLHKEPHESPKLMLLPMFALLIPSMFIGFILSSPVDLGLIDKHAFISFLDHNILVFPDYHNHEASFNFPLAITSSVLAVIGISAAILNNIKIKADFKNIRKLIANKYYLDYFYENVLVSLLFYSKFAKLIQAFEKNFIDRSNHNLTVLLNWFSNKFAVSQNGQLQLQSFTFIFGLVVAISTYIFWFMVVKS